jgi:hypothetical protein
MLTDHLNTSVQRRSAIILAPLFFPDQIAPQHAYIDGFWKQIFPFHSADVQKYLNELLFMPDALLMGQKSYEFFAQVWPTR